MHEIDVLAARPGLDRDPEARPRPSRMDERKRGRSWRSSSADQAVGISLRYVAIDVGSGNHVVAAVTANGEPAFKATAIAEMRRAMPSRSLCAAKRRSPW